MGVKTNEIGYSMLLFEKVCSVAVSLILILYTAFLGPSSCVRLTVTPVCTLMGTTTTANTSLTGIRLARSE